MEEEVKQEEQYIKYLEMVEKNIDLIDILADKTNMIVSQLKGIAIGMGVILLSIFAMGVWIFVRQY